MKKPVWKWIPTLYYAQGLPFSIVRQVAVVFFKDQGVSLASLGLVSLYGIPWTFKFAWSPVVDLLSTKRRWILAMEVLITLSLVAVFAAISFNGSEHLSHNILQLVAFIFLILATFAATHDVAIDGYYLENLEKSDQAKYSGWLPAASRLAFLTGSGALVAFAGRSGWIAAFAACVGLFLTLLIWHYFFLPRSSVRGVQPSNSQSPPRFIDGFQVFLKLPGVGMAVAFIFLFKIGDALLFGMSTPFLLDAGMTKQQLGLYSGGFGVTAAMVASLSGGWLVSRFGLGRMLWIFAFIQNLAIPVYAAASHYKFGTLGLVFAIVIEQLAAGWGASAYINFLMRQCDPRFKATHYAIVTSLMGFTTMLGGALSGFGASHFGYTVFFLIAFLASLPGMFLVPFIARRPECQLSKT